MSRVALDPAAPPNRLPWPPLILAAAAAGSVLAGQAAPEARLPGAGLARAVGAVLAVGGVALDLAAIATLRRWGTNVRPDRPASALVTTGPYAWTRNPTYLGNTLLLAASPG